jgi:hypothetical protein
MIKSDICTGCRRFSVPAPELGAVKNGTLKVFVYYWYRLLPVLVTLPRKTGTGTGTWFCF